MSRLLPIARALYGSHRYGPGMAWEDEPRWHSYYMADARTALIAVDDTFGACRVCGSPTRVIADLGMVPLANVFSSDAPRFPLRIQVCDECLLPQIEEPIDPSLMFLDYPYLSSMSQTFVDAAGRLVESLDVAPGRLVVEIGSNDGYLLRQYPETVRVLGVDPSNVDANVPTLREFFGEAVANQIREAHGPADVIHANNVVAHCPDPHTFFTGIKALLDVGGRAIIESPDVDGLSVGWDTIYHEHVFHWSVTAMCRIAEKHGLVVTDAEPITMHGGSMRYTLRHDGLIPKRVAARIAAEREMRWTIDRRIILDRMMLTRILDMHRRSGKRVCGYGAAAKGSVLIDVCGLELDFVCDSTPTKWGKVMPATSIPIVTTERLADADVAVLLPWNFSEEIRAREAWWSGEWVLPHEAPA